jgi:pyrroloquinoline quinone biosynthesis protein B
VRGPQRQLLYLPDIDGWDQWTRRVEAVVASLDTALLDGSFFSADELPGRDVTKIGHPLVRDTVARLSGLTRDIRFIHLNHSNPLHRAGPEREWLEAEGFRVGAVGDRWDL